MSKEIIVKVYEKADANKKEKIRKVFSTMSEAKLITKSILERRKLKYTKKYLDVNQPVLSMERSTEISPEQRKDFKEK